MKYAELESFICHPKRLSGSERDRFAAVVAKEFHRACVRFASDPATPWPRSLRMRRVVGAPGVWQLTWSFAGPDGRATFEWVEIDGELAVQWRRIGGHDIFGRP